MPMRYDVIVIGAGIVGLSSAFYIKKENPDLRVAVVERSPTYGQGNTGRSAAGLRDVFSSDLNYRLSNGFISFYRHVQDFGTPLGMKFSGYLFLMGKDDRRLDSFRELAGKIDLSFLPLNDLEAMGYLNVKPAGEGAKIMGLQDIETAVLGKNCGIVEPDRICSYYYNQCVGMGIEFFFNFNVRELSLEPVHKLDFPGEPFLWQEKTLGRITGSNGDLEADRFVLATDVWSTPLLDPTGIDSHVRPKKRQVFQVSGEQVEKMVFDDRFTGEGVCPFTILPGTGIYLRPAPMEKAFWVGVADDLNRDFSFTEDPQPENSFYEMDMLQVIRSYFPAFSSSRMTSGWAGYYSYNTIDKSPYIFQNLNIIVATGTSGSGILKGDAIGRTVEAVYSGKETVNLHNGLKFNTRDLGIYDRKVDPERIIL